ncbi:hypothetical protein SODALDRAFT_379178 [Sodiomyces alkalinus F11]|uniref:Uncharacterized protein n=1 Tax=Sodiomyces alkalinus (strain CBS 110278 / VKM F-3762 / F11) TaxID=1314773 RepID=A0A3N2PTV9_SODAK|nr:hypothetical protein SODALDRAFT_379178 [Sodiomyces alkalinus F11]ROT37938.1 hypothetical protein SODALDRAFT_379178 [Sodiomyces alkalinus F11]
MYDVAKQRELRRQSSRQREFVAEQLSSRKAQPSTMIPRLPLGVGDDACEIANTVIIFPRSDLMASSRWKVLCIITTTAVLLSRHWKEASKVLSLSMKAF